MNPSDRAKLQVEIETAIQQLKKLKENQPALDASLVQKRIDDLFTATVNHLGNKWPPQYNHLHGASSFFRISTNMARHTYNSICFTVADTRLKEPEWRWPYVFSMIPLNRTILDSIFNYVFMFEEFEHSWIWYCQAGYREVVAEISRQKSENSALPGYDIWISGREKSLQLLISEFNIPQEVIDNPERIEWWPNPGKMIRYRPKGQDKTVPLPDSRKFLQYLNDTYYGELSAQNHVSFRGLSTLGQMALHNTLSKEEQTDLEKHDFPTFRAMQASRTLLFSLSLLSELNYFFEFELDIRLLELWGILTGVMPEARSMFEIRYKALLPHYVIG
jgi:hypothetical protein